MTSICGIIKLCFEFYYNIEKNTYYNYRYKLKKKKNEIFLKIYLVSNIVFNYHVILVFSMQVIFYKLCRFIYIEIVSEINIFQIFTHKWFDHKKLPIPTLLEKISNILGHSCFRPIDSINEIVDLADYRRHDSSTLLDVQIKSSIARSHSLAF